MHRNLRNRAHLAHAVLIPDDGDSEISNANSDEDNDVPLADLILRGRRAAADDEKDESDDDEITRLIRTVKFPTPTVLRNRTLRLKQQRTARRQS